MKRKFFAGLTAAVLCLSAGTVQAGAMVLDPPYNLGQTWYQIDTDDMYDDLIDGINYVQGSGFFANGSGNVYRMNPINNQYIFVLKPDAASGTEIRKILMDCYSFEDTIIMPEYEAVDRDGQMWYYVYDRSDDPSECASAVMQALTERGLISAFYGCGEIFVGGLVTTQGALHYRADSEEQEALSRYIETAEIDYFLSPCQNSSGEDCCEVIPKTRQSTETLFRLGVDIYEATGLETGFGIAEVAVYMLRHNALERAGDLNIDGTADVSDAVLLARIVAEDDTRPAVCDTGYLNADVDGDGLVTVMDVTALLRTITEIQT